MVVLAFQIRSMCNAVFSKYVKGLTISFPNSNAKNDFSSRDDFPHNLLNNFFLKTSMTLHLCRFSDNLEIQSF